MLWLCLGGIVFGALCGTTTSSALAIVVVVVVVAVAVLVIVGMIIKMSACEWQYCYTKQITDGSGKNTKSASIEATTFATFHHCQ